MLYREIIAVCFEIRTKQSKYTVWAERRIFSAIAKLRKATISFVVSVCKSVRPSARNNSTTSGRIFMKFGI
jgi:hypothetical protein